MASLFVGQLCIFLHVSLLFLVGLRVVNIPFGRLIECCTYDVNLSNTMQKVQAQITLLLEMKLLKLFCIKERSIKLNNP